MLKTFMKMPIEHRIILGLCFIVLFVAIFRNNMSIGATAHVGSIRGTVELEAFENINDAMNNSSLCLFYAPWCGHCKRLKPTWDQFEKNNLDHKIKILSLNCDENHELAEKHHISGFPTIKYLPQGLATPENTLEYDGDRSMESLTEFLHKISGSL